MIFWFFFLSGILFWWTVGWIGCLRTMRRAWGEPSPGEMGEVMVVSFFLWIFVWPAAALSGRGHIKEAVLMLSSPPKEDKDRFR